MQGSRVSMDTSYMNKSTFSSGEQLAIDLVVTIPPSSGQDSIDIVIAPDRKVIKVFCFKFDKVRK
jgi:hypothetical protein